jgi:hypothetical protein
MKKFNKFGAANKNEVKFDSVIVTKYKEQDLPEDVLMIRCYTKKDECYVLYQPNYEEKQVGISLDRTTPFSDAVLTWLINSGTAERMMKEIYQILWGDTSGNTNLSEQMDSPIYEFISNEDSIRFDSCKKIQIKQMTLDSRILFYDIFEGRSDSLTHNNIRVKCIGD